MREKNSLNFLKICIDSWAHRMPLQTKIQILIIVVITVSLISGEYMMASYITGEMERQIGQRALAIARSVSQMPEVQRNLLSSSGYREIDPLAGKIRNTTQAEFIVVIDMEGVRYSHPVKDRIGEKIVGGDEGPVLEGKEYTSTAMGTLGPSLRAFVPIYHNDEQVGAVVVGILLTDVEKAIDQVKSNINLAVFVTILLGLIGAIILSNNIKKGLFGMEPIEIAALFEVRETILRSVKEGIIAIDENYRINLINQEAKKLLNIDGDVLGKPAEEVIPNTRLPEVLETGIPQIDREQLLNNRKILTNRIPIKVKNHIVGAVASFRDLTEIKRLAEELTGVREYAEALRAQGHEFKNKLHTISGLIQLQRYDQVVDYIIATQTKHKNNVDILINRIKDPYLGGLLFGKMALAAKKGVKIVMDENSNLPKLPSSLSGSLVLILGNLLQNAIEAVETQDNDDRRVVNLSISYNRGSIVIAIRDRGPGIPADVEKRIFEKGFTTRGHNNKGLGLSLINEQLEMLNGIIDVRTEKNNGTTFTVTIPHEPDEGV
jgi:sensor histidine kinase regulating citrate/malate metabolism